MTKQRCLQGSGLTPGQRIRTLRKAFDLTQQELANRVYVTQPAVSQWENDEWVPGRQSQALLAEVLHTTRDFLFGEQAA